MICERPWRKGIMSYRCGRCHACNRNKIRIWVGRLMTEWNHHAATSFITLTYNDKHVPCGNKLQKADLQKFLKRLRKRFYPEKFRFYAVGEYGDTTQRPHYHLILFGSRQLEEKEIEQLWPNGFTSLRPADEKNMAYTCGYTMKKMTKQKDPRLEGRTPEFATMSMRPGIGTQMVDSLVSAYRTPTGKAALKATGYIGTRARRVGFMYPLGQTITQKVVKALELTKEQRQEHNHKCMLAQAARQLPMSCKDYEKEYRAKIDQQRGRYKIRRKTTI